MTIRELYKWGEENNALDLPLFNFEDDCFVSSRPRIDPVFCYDESICGTIDMVVF